MLRFPGSARLPVTMVASIGVAVVVVHVYLRSDTSSIICGWGRKKNFLTVAYNIGHDVVASFEEGVHTCQGCVPNHPRTPAISGFALVNEVCYDNCIRLTFRTAGCESLIFLPIQKCVLLLLLLLPCGRWVHPDLAGRGSCIGVRAKHRRRGFGSCARLPKRSEQSNCIHIELGSHQCISCSNCSWCRLCHWLQQIGSRRR